MNLPDGIQITKDNDIFKNGKLIGHLYKQTREPRSIEIVIEPHSLTNKEQDTVYEEVCAANPEFYPADEVFIFEESLKKMANEKKFQEYLANDIEYDPEIFGSVQYPAGSEGQGGSLNFDRFSNKDIDFSSDPTEDFHGMDLDFGQHPEDQLSDQKLLSNLFGAEDEEEPEEGPDMFNDEDYAAGNYDSELPENFYNDSDFEPYTESLVKSEWHLLEDYLPQHEDLIYFVDTDGDLGIGIYNDDMHAIAMSDGMGVRIEDVKQWTYVQERQMVGYPEEGQTVAIEMPDISVPALAMFTEHYNCDFGQQCRAAVLDPVYCFEGMCEGDTVVAWELVTSWYPVPEIDELRALEDYTDEPEMIKEDPEHQHLITMDMIYDAAREARKNGTYEDEGFDLTDDADIDYSDEESLLDDRALALEAADLEDDEEALKSELASLKDKPELRIDEKPEYEGLFNDFDEKQLRERHHTWSDFEGSLEASSQEDRDQLIDYINKHKDELVDGHVDEAVPMEDEYNPEDEDEEETFKRSIILKGSTDRNIYDLERDLWEELEAKTNIGIDELDLEETGYTFESYDESSKSGKKNA